MRDRPLRPSAGRGVSGEEDGGAASGGGAAGDESDVARAAIAEPTGRFDPARRGEAAVPTAVCGVRAGCGDWSAAGV